LTKRDVYVYKITIMKKVKIFIFSAFLFVPCVGIVFSSTLELRSSTAYESAYENSASDVAVDSQGNIIIAGTNRFEGYEAFITLKYDPDLSEILGYDIHNRDGDDTAYEDEAHSVAVDCQDNIIVAGVTAIEVDTNTYINTFYIVKYSTGFEIISSTMGPQPDTGSFALSRSAIAVDGDGNNVLAVSIATEEGFNYHIIRYNHDLTEIVNSVENVTAEYDFVSDLAIDSQGNVIVTGYRMDDEVSWYYTVKYNSELTLLSEHIYDDVVGNYHNWAWGVAVDGSDNIIVTGISGYETGLSSVGGYAKNMSFAQGSYSGNYYTVKYSPDLTVLETASYNSGGGDMARSVAVDSSGNIIVTGQVGGQGDGNYHTIAYDSGLNRIASVSYNSGNADGAEGIAVNGNNIIVAGTTDFEGHPEIFTLNYFLRRLPTRVSPDDEGEVKVVVPEGGGTRGTINPDSGQPVTINFKGSRAGSYTLRIFTQLGEQVHSERISADSAEGWFEWLPKGLASGVYFVHVKGPGVDIYEKIALLR